MINLAATNTVAGICASATSVTYTITGMELAAGVETYKVLAQGQLPGSATALYTVPASTNAFVKTMHFQNTTAGGLACTFYVNGTTGPFQIMQLTVPANGTAIFNQEGWFVYDSSGVMTFSSPITLTGDVTGSGSGTIATTLATVNGAPGTFGSASQVAQVTVNGKGLSTTVANVTITPAAIGAVPTTRTITTTTPIQIDGGAGPTDLSANRTLSILPATTALAGSLSALDKLKVDNMWVDVTANTVALVTPAQSAATNTTNIGTLLAGVPNGSTIYFPKGAYSFSGTWTMPNKMFTFLGEGANRAGSPATAFTELKWTSNVGATLITLPGTGNGWYTRFVNLTFTTTVDQTVGGVVDANGNVGIDFLTCAMQSNGGFFNDLIIYGGGAGSNSANSTVIDDCHLQGFKGVGVRVNSAGSSLVISNSVIQGQWGSSSQMATAGISGGWVGALQINDCDVLGCVNNLLTNPVAASSEVCASIFCTNTYFDNSLGSCIKVSGTGGTVRCRFDTCSFTTGTGATDLSAVELASTFAYAAGGQGLDFVNCNVLNTFATTGTTNGFLISGTADFTIGNCRIAGWTNGVQVTPIATAGVTQLQINNNTIGPAGGFAGNGSGIVLNAGGAAYGAIIIESNHLSGNTTTPLTDNSLATGATITVKSINGNTGLVPGVGGIVSRGGIVTTTAETSVARIPIPALSLKVGSSYRYELVCVPTAATIITARCRFGTAGTVADAAVAIMSANAVAVGAGVLVVISGLITIQAVGAGATTARGAGRSTTASNLIGTGNAAATAAFSSTVANFLTVSLQNTTSTTTTVIGGYLEGCT